MLEKSSGVRTSTSHEGFGACVCACVHMCVSVSKSIFGTEESLEHLERRDGADVKGGQEWY